MKGLSPRTTNILNKDETNDQVNFERGHFPFDGNPCFVWTIEKESVFTTVPIA